LTYFDERSTLLSLRRREGITLGGTVAVCSFVVAEGTLNNQRGAGITLMKAM
jgi:hypothetical protein